MMAVKRVVCLAAGLGVMTGCSAPAVKATPEDSVVITDTLFGLNDDTLYVLRSTRDNLGLHMASRTETWLVAIDAATGDETLWPVGAVVRSTRWDKASGSEFSTVEQDEGLERVDPFAILAENDAIPILDLNHMSDDGDTKVENSGGRVRVGYGDDQAYSAAMETLKARYRSSVETLAARVADYKRMGGLSTRELYRNTLTDTLECTYTRQGWPRRFAVEGPAYQMVRVSCPPHEYGEGHSLIQLLPQEAAPVAR